MNDQSSHSQNQLERAHQLLDKKLDECLKHGFFTLVLRGVRTDKGRTELFIEGGPSYKCTIPLDEIPEMTAPEAGASDVRRK